MTSEPATSLVGRLSVAERLARLLSVVPWVVGQGGANLHEISDRFNYPREQLLEDLTQVLFFVGVHPFTPDVLIEVEIIDEFVEIRYADWFSRPLRLTDEEATRLIAAGRSVLDLTAGLTAEPVNGEPSEDQAVHDLTVVDDQTAAHEQTAVDDQTADATAADPLLRALAKLSLALGDGVADAARRIDVSLGDAPAKTLKAVRSATAQRRRVEIEYYSFGRDALTRRAVDPARVFSHDGEWYLSGWCQRADAERVFRVDRIRSVSVTDQPVEVDMSNISSDPVSGIANLNTDATLTLRLDAEVAWAADYYPTQHREELGDGRVEATFEVAGISWLERLLLQLGGHADIVAHDETIEADIRARTAQRVLQRYER